MMTGVFLILFICCFFFPCQGVITSPPDGTSQTVLPGSIVTITWSFNDTISDVTFREWRFTSSDRSFVDKSLAAIVADDDDPRKFDSGLSGVSVLKPATLLLKNVNQTYDGTYQFRLSGQKNVHSDVVVYIARKPTVTINCSSPITVKEDDDLICLCKGENGNPPADVVWYDKNGNAIGQKEKEQKTLVLRSVTKADGGAYTCKAKSYTLMDEKSIDVKVNFKPKETNIEFSRNPAIIGKEVTITCSSNGEPNPSFTIIHNRTINITVIEETHTIPNATWDDAGHYTCVAINELGSNSSDPEFLDVKGPTPTPIPPSPPSSSTSNQDSEPDVNGDSGGLGGGAIAGIVIGVLALLVIITVVVYYCKSKERNGHQGYGSEHAAAENTYDTAGPSVASGSTTKPSKNDTPVEYSTVDKENRQGRPLYATLDEAAMRPPDNRRTLEQERLEPTQYASIEFGKTAEVPKADLVSV